MSITRKQLHRFWHNVGIFQFGHLPTAGQLIANNNERDTFTLMSYYTPLVTIVDYSAKGKPSRLLVWPQARYSTTDISSLQTWLSFFNVTNYLGEVIDARWLLAGNSNNARLYTDLWGKAVVVRVHSYQPYAHKYPQTYRDWANSIY